MNKPRILAAVEILQTLVEELPDANDQTKAYFLLSQILEEVNKSE